MKRIVKILMVVVAAWMLLGTGILFLDDIKLLFTRESAAYLSQITDPNIVWAVVFLIIYLSLLYVLKLGIRKICLLFLVFCCWLMSGRVMAYKAFPDGRIITGWYYLETDKFNLCSNNIDCETVIYRATTIKKMPLWRISINNKYVNKVIFVGPFAWKNFNRVTDCIVEKVIEIPK